MMLDASYFVGDLYLPNIRANSAAPGVAGVLDAVGSASLDYYIEKYEAEFLVRLLGRDLADAFRAGLTEEPVRKEWRALRDKIYRKEGRYPYSPAAGYVYYWIMRDGATQTTRNGEVRAEQDYARIASPARKMVDAWNRMIPYVLDVRAYIEGHAEDYRPYGYTRLCPCEALGFTPINLFNI